MSAFDHLQFVRVGHHQVAYRKVGEGPTIVLIHGWPLSSATWRRVVKSLAGFTCIAPDLPGLGETRVSSQPDLAFPAQAEILRGLLDALAIEDCAVVAHDSGGSIARLWAAEDARVTDLTLLNTELPGHHPAGLQLFVTLSRLPLAALLFRTALRSRRFLESRYGFRGCFWDMRTLDDEFVRLFIRPLIESPERLSGALAYAAAVDFEVIDALAATHQALNIPVRFIWGADDPWFPLRELERVLPQFRQVAGVRRVPRARLFLHEEYPELVADELTRALSKPGEHPKAGAFVA